MFNLRSFYQNGVIGDGRDLVKASEWWTLAAKEGHVEAQYFIGQVLMQLKLDNYFTQAIYWWKKAAAQGNTTAQVVGPSSITMLGHECKFQPDSQANLCVFGFGRNCRYGTRPSLM
jgi:TPR repeat protein